MGQMISGVPVSREEFCRQLAENYMIASAAGAFDKYMRPCECDRPTPMTRPSGAKICMNDQCGGHLAPPPESKQKP